MSYSEIENVSGGSGDSPEYEDTDESENQSFIENLYQTSQNLGEDPRTGESYTGGTPPLIGGRGISAIRSLPRLGQAGARVLGIGSSGTVQQTVSSPRSDNIQQLQDQSDSLEEGFAYATGTETSENDGTQPNDSIPYDLISIAVGIGVLLFLIRPVLDIVATILGIVE